MYDATSILSVLRQGFLLAFEFWWVWFPFILWSVARSLWLDYLKDKYLAGMKWVVLEVVPPPEILYSSPMAAQNFFAGLHASYGGGIKWKDQYFAGKVPDWFSLEIVSHGGETHFYIRCTEGQRNTVEALLFAQYPQAEIKVTGDYISLLPDDLDMTQYDVSGTEFVGSQPPAYPIRSWTEFEDAGGKDEYARLDPLAPLLEMMSALRPGEYLWLQYIFRPTGGDWVKEGQAVVDKMLGKEPKAPETPLTQKIALAPFTLLGFLAKEFGLITPAEEKKKEDKPFSMGNLTPSDKLALEGIQRKLSMVAFKTTIRVLYVARKDAFNGARPASLTAMFKQLFYNNMNTFKPGAGTKDKGKFSWLFPNDKGFGADEATLGKKKGMYGSYRKRAFSRPPGGPKDFPLILNVEELATLWHLPGLNVRAPLLPRVQAKKGQPPAFLPTRNS